MKINTSKNMLKRLLILGVVIVFLLSTNAVRVLYLQVVRGEELSQKAESQQMADTEISAMRGTIYDAEGNILAKSATVWNIYLDPKAVDLEILETDTAEQLLPLNIRAVRVPGVRAAPPLKLIIGGMF